MLELCTVYMDNHVHSSTAVKELLELQKDHARGNRKALIKKVNNYLMKFWPALLRFPSWVLNFRVFRFRKVH
jgi:hypothetical protein